MADLNLLWVFIFSSYGYILGISLAVPIFVKHIVLMKYEANEISLIKKNAINFSIWSITLLSIGGVMRAVIRYARINEQDTVINNMVSLILFFVGLFIVLYVYGLFHKISKAEK